MEVCARMRFLRIAPRKVRRVVDLVRGRSVEDALHTLRVSPQTSARPIKKLIESAVVNAQHKGNIDIDTLIVKKIMVDHGPTLKRWMPRAQGRATRINKRTSHIFVALEEA